MHIAPAYQIDNKTSIEEYIKHAFANLITTLHGVNHSKSMCMLKKDSL